MTTTFDHAPELFRIDIHEAGQDTRTDSDFLAGFNTSFRAAAYMYYWFAAADLLKKGARLVVMRCPQTGEAVAGVYGTVDDRNVLHIGGAWTRQYHRGRGLIGQAVDALRLSFLGTPGSDQAPVTQATLDVRIIDGVPNRSALRAYQRVGFVETKVDRVFIKGTDRDGHLALTAEADGHFLTQVMTADLASLTQAVERLAARGGRCAA